MTFRSVVLFIEARDQLQLNGSDALSVSNVFVYQRTITFIQVLGCDNIVIAHIVLFLSIFQTRLDSAIELNENLTITKGFAYI